MDGVPSRKSPLLFWACFLPIFLLSLWALWRNLSHKEEEPPFNRNGYSEFNLSETPKPEAQAASSADYGALPARASSSLPRFASGLSGFVPESRGDSRAKADSRQREQAFLREYDPIIRQEQERMKAIINKYWKKYPIVRQIDKEIQGMDRVMALGRQYNKDRDFYKWGRGLASLPEFRQAVFKYSTNPQVWKAAIGMTLEALKNPPPPQVYNELLKFFTEDPVVSKQTPELMGAILSNMPGMMLQAIPPGSDVTPLQGLMSELLPSANIDLPLVHSGDSSGYWEGYKKGYQDGLRLGAQRNQRK